MSDKRISDLERQLEEAKTAIREWFALQEKIRKSPPPPHTDYWHQSIWYAEKKLKDVIGEVDE